MLWGRHRAHGTPCVAAGRSGIEHFLSLNVLALGLALGWDLLVGEPPSRFHFVVWIGRVGRVLYGHVLAVPSSWQVVAGALPPALMMAAAVGLGVGVGTISRHGPLEVVALFAWVYLLKCTFAIRALTDAGREVAVHLHEGDLEKARHALRSLVSRDVAGLDSQRVASAAVESLGENLCDSVVAPLFFYVVFGLPGALAYRVVNTLDAMYGYHGALERAGKVAARLDDVMNLVPARLSSFVLWLVTCWKAGVAPLRAAWNYRGLTESPNAGWTMATLAGALGVTLEKPGHYVIPAGHRYPDYRHLLQACGFTFRASVFSAVVALAGGLARAL